jgi:hypothetical protein
VNRRSLLHLSLLPAMAPFVSAADAARDDAATADECALLAAFFRAGVESPDSHIGQLALSAAALYREGHTDGFASVVDRGVAMVQGGSK